MLEAVLGLMALGAVAPLVYRFAGRFTGWLLAAVPAYLFGLFLFYSPIAGRSWSEATEWIPGLGIELSFHLDGLSSVFGLLVTGVGTLVLIYAGGYMKGDPRLGRLYCILLIFMGAMLGLVLTDDLLVLFVFWEITSITSYLLVGFDHQKPEARKAALRALLVTGAGGLALLVGILMIHTVAGTYSLSTLHERSDLLHASPSYLPILLLVFLGAFTKSAQMPFHFWLPGAMSAPTPVSAYLHSATMVKAGIYLLARLQHELGGTDEWHYILSFVGVVTMATGAIMALGQEDLKGVLAYTTVSALGTLVLLLGIGTDESVKAAMVFLVVHAFYKGALFMVVGIVDHETGTRQIGRLGGLRRSLPITFAAALLACMSMSGLAPFLGFISKELMYEANIGAPRLPLLLTVGGVLGNLCTVTAAVLIVHRTFLGERGDTPKKPHEAPVAMWIGPIVLAIAGLTEGMSPGEIGDMTIGPAVQTIQATDTEVHLALWHGINPVLLLSLATIAAGFLVYTRLALLRRLWRPIAKLAGMGPARAYEVGLGAVLKLATATARVSQHGFLRNYLALTYAAGFAFVGIVFLVFLDERIVPADWQIYVYEGVLVSLLVVGSLTMVFAPSRILAVVALGLVGFTMALLFLSGAGPDLAMTQTAVEALSVVLLLFVLLRMPKEDPRTSRGSRVRDAALAALAGVVTTAIVFSVLVKPVRTDLAEWFARESVPSGKGRNVVNVILVDFRGIDTMGEIVVLAAAAVGFLAAMNAIRKRVAS